MSPERDSNRKHRTYNQRSSTSILKSDISHTNRGNSGQVKNDEYSETFDDKNNYRSKENIEESINSVVKQFMTVNQASNLS